MAFEGYVDHATRSELSGWVFDNGRPGQPLDLEILDGQRVIARITAGDFRADLLSARKGDGRHGFSFTANTPAAEPLTARVAGRRWIIPPAGGVDLRDLLPMRFESTLAHRLEYGLPLAISWQGFSSAGNDVDSIGVANRLIRAYRKTIADHPEGRRRKRDMWADMESYFHCEILSILKGNDAAALAAYLSDAHAKGLCHGVTQGERTTKALQDDATARRLVMLATLDHLVSLGESIGVLDVECPDQHGQWGENIHRDPDEIIGKITAAIGIPVALPQVIGSAFGLATDDGVITTRDLHAIHAALRIKALLGKDPRTSSAFEIGGGLGAVAYYANRLGIGQYTIIDLPLLNLLQGYFLIHALPTTAIALYGEPAAKAAIQLLPTYVFADNKDQCDLLFNQDSFPEMHRDYAIGYLRAASAKKIPLILSINQEARAKQIPTEMQTPVRELVAMAGGYQRKSRFRHWLRAGYVEEIYVRPASQDIA